MVLAFFALSAMILSAVGLHGVLSQLVAQRIPEFGIRRAVGAQTRDLICLIARQGGVAVVAGLAAGVCLCWAPPLRQFFCLRDVPRALTDDCLRDE